MKSSLSYEWKAVACLSLNIKCLSLDFELSLEYIWLVVWEIFFSYRKIKGDRRGWIPVVHVESVHRLACEMILNKSVAALMWNKVRVRADLSL